MQILKKIVGAAPLGQNFLWGRVPAHFPLGKNKVVQFVWKNVLVPTMYDSIGLIITFLAEIK